MPVQISGLCAVAQLGPPSETWSELGARSVHLIDEYGYRLTPSNLGKLVTATALIPDAWARGKLYGLMPEMPSAVRRQLGNALGVAHDPAVVRMLLSAATRADRIAARALSTYPEPALQPYLAQLRAAIAHAVDLDSRLWLGVTVAKQHDPGPLLSVLDEITPDSVPRSLYGPSGEVEARFRDVGRLPDEVTRYLAAYAHDDRHPRHGRRIASLLTGEAVAAEGDASPQMVTAASELADQVAALQPDDTWSSQSLHHRIEELRHLPAHKVPALLDAAVDLSFSPEPEVRSLARDAADRVARPDVIARDDLPAVHKAIPRYQEALRKELKGQVRQVVEQTCRVGSSDDYMGDVIEHVLGDKDPVVQAGLFDVLGGFAPTADLTAGSAAGLPAWVGMGQPLDDLSGGPPDTPGGGPGEPGGEPPDAPAGVVYPRLDAPPSVRPEMEFTLTVGLRSTPDRQVERTGFDRPVLAGVHELKITLMPGVFRLADPLREHLYLTVTPDDPTPWTQLTLNAPALAAVAGGDGYGAVTARYFLDQQPLGAARRRILVGDQTAGLPLDEAEAPPMSTGDEWVDLSVEVSRRGDVHVWSAIGPHGGSLHGGSDLERDARKAITLIEEIRAKLDQRARNVISDRELRTALKGKLLRIRKAIPEKIWAAIVDAAQAAQKAMRVPRIVLCTDDANLPWEAAFLGGEALVEAPDGATQAPYLGAQAAVGRYGETPGSLGTPPPLVAASVRVLAPRYQLTEELVELGAASDEAAKVTELFAGADVQPLPDDLEQVLALLEEGPYPDVLHIAAHGRLQRQQGGAVLQGLPLLGDRGEVEGSYYTVKYLEPDQVSSIGGPGLPGLGRHTLVFLNICFAAAGTTVLGQAVSLANAFADAGAFGVVAPLWQVEDERASSYALELYRLARTVPIAEAVRQLRNRSSDKIDATWLAYRFFGHPQARLQPADSAAQ